MDEKRLLADWLGAYQAVPDPDAMVAEFPDPARARANLARVIDGNLAALPFETETATFTALLHELAPRELKAGEP
ncbi:MAG: hypothetical protein VW338_09475 [Rhodospirillaceae bacterium]